MKPQSFWHLNLQLVLGLARLSSRACVLSLEISKALLDLSMILTYFSSLVPWMKTVDSSMLLSDSETPVFFLTCGELLKSGDSSS